MYTTGRPRIWVWGNGWLEGVGEFGVNDQSVGGDLRGCGGRRAKWCGMRNTHHQVGDHGHVEGQDGAVEHRERQAR